jgi:hypothetical protein
VLECGYRPIELTTLSAETTEKIARWLVGAEPGPKLLFQSDLAHSQNARSKGTCGWIFDHSDYKTWYSVNRNVVGWYHAPPGSGKTVMSASIAERIEQNGLCAYYRFQYDDITRKTTLNALRSIALQLRTITGKIPDQVLEIYHKEIDRHAYQLQDLETALQIVEAFILKIPRIHIVVDGLDECSDLNVALRVFTRLAQCQTLGITKWLFTSRSEAAIENAMAEMKAIAIIPPSGAIMSDISLFLDLQDDKVMTEECKCSDCIQYWTAASEENFLYSRLMFDTLCGNGVTCSDEIHEELQKFPPGLTGCYVRCLDTLAQRTQLERNLARYVLLAVK